MAKPIAAAAAVLLYIFAAQAFGLWLFTGGFLLTRTTLEDTASCPQASAPLWTPPLPAFTGTGADETEAIAWEKGLLSHAECTLPATYKQTVLWIIDALRYDYIADAEVETVANTSWTPNPHYHNAFLLPSQLHRQSGSFSFSFLSHFLADAPTTTLQRLKGLTTGSLPTFIDAGSNFGGSVISEDTWLAQLRFKTAKDGRAGMGFVGDDTWVTVFPSLFDQSWTWPYDSFNVEDLDGVDRGVESKLDEFLQPNKAENMSDWRLLVAHMLGVDHVGHRLGASHPRMRTKLQEMDTFMARLVDGLPDDALLVLMGDHGMDERGDHGGDGELEVGAGLWMYSKTSQHGKGLSDEVLESIAAPSRALIPSHLPFSPLPSPPFAHRGHRSVPQIDFVPTISLLMGLPIPFNNLGSVIPEAFGSLEHLLRALRINAIQIHRYLQEYSQASRDLQPFQDEIESAWRLALLRDADYSRAYHGSSAFAQEQAMKEACAAYTSFNRLSLVRAKGIWAQFEMNKMVVGLSMLLVSLLTCFSVKATATAEIDAVALLARLYNTGKRGAGAGAVLMAALKLISLYVKPIPALRSLSLLETIGAGAALGGQVPVIVSSPIARLSPSTAAVLGFALPVLHSAAFSSNSFTVHEDRLVLVIAVLALGFRGAQGYLSGPTTRLKARVPAFALMAMLCLRLSSLVKVCREEQAPHCTSTFYSAGDSSLSSIWTIAAAYVCAAGLPSLTSRALNMSRSFAGVAPLFLNWMFRPALLLAAGYWFVDWLFTAEHVSLQEDTPAYAALQWAKLALARADMALIAIVGLSFWVFSPLCLELTKENVEPAQRQQQQQPPPPPGPSSAQQQRVIVLGFANSFGSSYLLLLSLVFALQFLVAQPSGQVALTLVYIALFCCAEIGDGERDTALLQERIHDKDSSTPATPPPSLPVSFLETSTLALIGFVAFFSTGHQATFASIQWRSAFVGFETVNYPFSPALVILNAFGPLALLPSMAVAFLALWNLAPRPRAAQKSGEKAEKMAAVMHILQASLSFLLYHLLIALSSAAFAAHFRRHL